MMGTSATSDIPNMHNAVPSTRYDSIFVNIPHSKDAVIVADIFPTSRKKIYIYTLGF